MNREIDRRDFSINKVTPVREAELNLAATEISDMLPGAHQIRIERFDTTTGNPSIITSESAIADSGNYIQRALTHVQKISRALGLATTQAIEFTPAPIALKTSSGAVAIHLQQNYKGIPIFGATEVVRFAPDGRLKRTLGKSVTISAELSATPKISVQEAVKKAAEYITMPNQDEIEAPDQVSGSLHPAGINIANFEPTVIAAFPEKPERSAILDSGPFGERIKASLLWFPLSTELRLAWEVILSMPNYQEQYRTLVDAQNGDIIYCHQLVQSAAGQGNVYHENGGNPRQMTNFPIPLANYGLPIPTDLPTGFPDDWITLDTTLGNNVVARHTTSGTTVQGSMQGGVLTFTPTNATGDDQQVLNVFYWCNYMHDYFYLLGFREADGNFQQDNYGRGNFIELITMPIKFEVGNNDPVRAYVEPGQIAGLATMASNHIDGSIPTMTMGIVNSSNRHTALDSDIVFHEYTHGVTNRLVGGPLIAYPLSDPQSDGMAEGWSDYTACTINNKTVHGDWVHNNPGGGRNYPYDSSFPDHFGDLGTIKGVSDYTKVHDIGTIWCATLMEMNRNIGAILGVQLVVDALKLTPANPSFLDGRDAILEALDDMHVAGKLSDSEFLKAWRSIWNAFAKFGMGPAAKSNAASLTGIVADFNVLSVKKIARICLGEKPPISVRDDILRPSENHLKPRLEELLRSHF